MRINTPHLKGTQELRVNIHTSLRKLMQIACPLCNTSIPCLGNNLLIAVLKHPAQSSQAGNSGSVQPGTHKTITMEPPRKHPKAVDAVTAYLDAQKRVADKAKEHQENMRKEREARELRAQEIETAVAPFTASRSRSLEVKTLPSRVN